VKRGLNTKHRREIPVAHTGPSSRGVDRGDAAPEETLVTAPKNKVDSVDGRGRWTPPPAGVRIAEIGEILSLGYLRLLGLNTRGKAGHTGDGCLDISLGQSGHTTSVSNGGSRG
jgi:hypothetical protein